MDALVNPWKLVKNGKKVRFSPPFTSILACLLSWNQHQPAAIAIDYIDVDNPNRNWHCTWGELLSQVYQTQALLGRLGVSAGDAITFAYENSPEILILSLAAWTVGVVTVPLDVKRDEVEMAKYKLEVSKASALFSLNTSDVLHFTSEARSLGIKKVTYAVYDRTESKITKHSVVETPLTTPALVLFTSGTTAKPKGALLTQQNLIANADGIADWLQINNSDRFLILLPLHHVNSITMSLATVLRGGTVILLSRYSNSKFFALAARTRATLTSVVPTIIHDQLDQLKNWQEHRENIKLTRIQLGSAPVQPQEAAEFVNATGIPLVQGYGQTETSLRSTGAHWNPALPLGPSYWQQLRDNSIGVEMKWTNVTVLRADGLEAKEDEEGEICVRGPVIMRKYLNNPEATREVFRYGWFHSGDVGFWKNVDGKKQFYLKGRIKEIIIKAGINISPLYLEQQLKKQLSGIDQVYVVGIPDDRVGEEIAAVVVWKGQGRRKGEVRSRKKGLSQFEAPKYWFSVKVNDLPMTSTGKTQRVRLKQLFARCTRLAETNSHIFRPISPLEADVIESARQIHNRRWQPMTETAPSWEKLISGKTLIGVFRRKTGRLEGSIICEDDGKSLLCTAISVEGKPFSYHIPKHLPKVTPAQVNRYLAQHTDPVILFHQRPKSGSKSGAKIIQVIKNARPADVVSLGFGVLMEYPPIALSGSIQISEKSTLGTQLVESAMLFAKRLGCQRVRVLTRPVGLMSWARKQKHG